MPLHEIPKSRWKDFCDSFSRAHQGWSVYMRVDQEIQAKELPLPLEMVDGL